MLVKTYGKWCQRLVNGATFFVIYDFWGTCIGGKCANFLKRQRQIIKKVKFLLLLFS